MKKLISIFLGLLVASSLVFAIPKSPNPERGTQHAMDAGKGEKKEVKKHKKGKKGKTPKKAKTGAHPPRQ